MIYLDCPVQEIAEKYGFKKRRCGKCNTELNLNRPFRMKGHIGVEFEKCKPCGNPNASFTVTPTSKEEIDFWRMVI